MKSLKNEIFLLLERASTSLPGDVEKELKSCLKREESKSGKKVLREILENVEIAKQGKVPICQDTGTVNFFVTYSPKKHTEAFLHKEITSAVKTATEKSILRPNSVIFNGENIGNIPEIYFTQGNKLKIEVLLKGGGSENCTRIYKLPCENLNAKRDLGGVNKCVLHAVQKAQGKGCPPYVLGVAIGGSANSAMFEAKKQLLRKLGDKNKNKKLAAFERQLLKDVNALGIGPMGMGGKNTAFAVKISALPRHPATYFVAVAFSCWCDRRANL